MEEEQKREEPKAKPELLDVRVVGIQGESALVELGGLKRVYVPARAVKDGQVSETAFKRGVPYGVPWEKVKLEATAEDLADNLRRVGIWTADDLRKRQAAALGALQATYKIDLASLNRLAREAQ